MRVVIQRVAHASVSVNNTIVSEIKNGLLILAGIEDADTPEDVEWLSHRIINLRIFDDENKVPNISVKEMGGDILLVRTTGVLFLCLVLPIENRFELS